jgi:hypothetical protein
MPEGVERSLGAVGQRGGGGLRKEKETGPVEV